MINEELAQAQAKMDQAVEHTAGEFGHNDFYPVVIAAAHAAGLDGRAALLGMVCLDEIRGRLAEVFSLKSYKIDHVVHGAIASAAVYGAMLGATPEQIESAIGMFVAHYVPWRAIRAGHHCACRSCEHWVLMGLAEPVCTFTIRRTRSIF